MSRILIIEDSSYIRKLMRDILEADGHSIVEAEDGVRGLKAATTEAPDCILLDLIMPDMNGITLLKALSNQGSTIPVIVVSAHLLERVREQCMALGASAFIGKPPRENQLRHAVRKVLSLT